MSSRQSAGLATICRMVAAAALSTVFGCSGSDQPTAGVVVESCEPGEAAAVAGLVPGDVVVEWRQGRANGAVHSVFHLAIVEQELAPHGPVVLTVERGSKTLSVIVPVGLWQLRTRPKLVGDELALYREARELEGNDELDGAVDTWRTLARAATGPSASWAHTRAAVALAKSERRDDCLAALDDGVRTIADPRLRAAYWEQAGKTLLESGQNALAAGAFGRVIAILDEGFPTSPALAHALLKLCRTDFRACYDRADRAITIYQKTGERSIELANALNTAAAVAFYRSDLETAEESYLKALEMTREVAPGSPTELNLLGNLGLVAMRFGDFDTARSYYKRELEAAENLGVDCIPYAYANNYLGLLAKNLGRYDEAQLYYEQALRAFAATRPNGVEVAGVLNNLGIVAQYRENLRTAREYHEEALDLRRRLDPASSDVASSLHNVGSIAWRQGDMKVAREHLELALDLKRSFQGSSLWIATTHFELGDLARAEGALEEAIEHHRIALDIRRRVAPRHPDVASSLISLGGIESHSNRPDKAEVLLLEAVDLIEQQRSRLDISEQQRAQFKARYRYCYIDLAGLLVDQGREPEAWNLLEQARAGALRSVVGYRGSIPDGVPPDLWFAKARAESRLARVESRLARLDPRRDAEDLVTYRGQLTAVEAELDEMAAEIRKVAPAFVELENPDALSLDQVRRRLDPGTLVLSFSVGADRGMAMMTTAAGGGGLEIRSFGIPIGEDDLRQRIQRFNALLARGASSTDMEQALLSQARKLFDLLVAPAWDEITRADRLLVVPDGPLHELPFAALATTDEATRFLGLAKPVFVNPSATTAVEIGRSRPRPMSTTRTIAAFGGPTYPSDSLRVAEHRLSPLPGSRIEVEAIRRLFDGNAVAFLGPEASEANFRTRVGDATILHCALHTRSDPHFPMDSALFFSFSEHPPDQENDGILTAWDVVDGLRISADTVVLSSCSTARGRVIAGEGIIGLARAFQVAGAKTLVASQWAIPDHSTAALMTAFYEALATGDSTVDAMHRAQRTIAGDPELAHPYHWASFQVWGDWR